MTIREYIKLLGITQKKFAEKFGITDVYLSMIIKGRRRPGPDLAKRMVEETNGALSLEYLLFGTKRN